MIGSFRTGAARRFGALLTGAGLLLAGGVVFASAASAHASQISGTASCNDNGTWSVTWKFTNDFGAKATVTKVTSTGGGTLGLPVTIPAKTGSSNTSVTAAQANIPGTSSSTTLTAKVTWADNYSTTVSKKIDRPSGCTDKRGASATKTTCQAEKPGVTITLTNKKGATAPVTFSVGGPTTTEFKTVGNSSSTDTTATAFVPVTPGVSYTIVVTTDDGFSKVFKDTLAVCNAPGIQIEKELLTEGSVHPGATLDYKVTVTNTGNTTLYGVKVTDAIPPGASFVAEGSDPRWDKDSTPLTATIGELGKGDSTDLVVRLKVSQLANDEFECSGGTHVTNTASVEGFYPQPSPSSTPSGSSYSMSATANPAVVDFPDCATIVVIKNYVGEEGGKPGWSFTTAFAGGLVNRVEGSDTEETAAGGLEPRAQFILKGYLGEGTPVTITEESRAGWELTDVRCYWQGADVARGAAVSMEMDSSDGPLTGVKGLTKTLNVLPGDDIVCYFTNKHTPGGGRTPSKTPSTSTSTPTPTTTPTTEVLGEKATATPSPTTAVAGGKLPFTGAPVGAGLLLSLILLAGGGALLLFSSASRGAKHRG